MAKKKNEGSEDELTWTIEEEKRYQFLVGYLRVAKNWINEAGDGYSDEYMERKDLGWRRYKYFEANPSAKEEFKKKIKAWSVPG